ncbi:hypothetical protein [Sphingomonas qomolangmaensis]|uniref:Uncharacterized protein n=1 Tax=Sphingomonas qomolangmaensis TaxID=2918765 RepID=A0ABY5LBI2_9SPHN|nr:hypothetical protein [Sphingomonas qomolangmaensis]UUL83175.1 hypothetical protein NMP03_02765 [Sphingomonas qomolangmaensis]
MARGEQWYEKRHGQAEFNAAIRAAAVTTFRLSGAKMIQPPTVQMSGSYARREAWT